MPKKASPPAPTDYRGIAAWGQAMRSFSYYVRQQQERALQEGAPLDAIYRKEDGTWATAGDIKNKELADSIQEALA